MSWPSEVLRQRRGDGCRDVGGVSGGGGGGGGNTIPVLYLIASVKLNCGAGGSGVEEPVALAQSRELPSHCHRG